MATGAWANEQKQACHHQLAKLHPEVTKDVGTPTQAQATAGPWAWAYLQRQACHRQLAKLHPEVTKDVGTPTQARAAAGPWAWAYLQRQACHRQLAKLHPEVIKGGVGCGGARKVFFTLQSSPLCYNNIARFASAK